MNNTLQLYVDDEKTIKGYPVTSPDRVIDENGKSVKDKLKNNVKFDVVGQGVGAPPIDGGNAELVEKVDKLEEQMGAKASKNLGFDFISDFGGVVDNDKFDNSNILKNALIQTSKLNGTLYLPKGKIYCKTPIVIDDEIIACNIIGKGGSDNTNKGTNIIYEGDDYFLTFNNRVYTTTFKNFRLTGSGTNKGILFSKKNKDGIFFKSLFYGLWIANFKNCMTCNYAVYSYIEKCTFITSSIEDSEAIVYNGYEYNYFKDTSIANGNAELVNSTGIKINGGQVIYFSGMDIVDFKKGILFDSSINTINNVYIENTSLCRNFYGLYFNVSKYPIEDISISNTFYWGSCKDINERFIYTTRPTGATAIAIIKLENIFVRSMGSNVTPDYLIENDNTSSTIIGEISNRFGKLKNSKLINQSIYSKKYLVDRNQVNNGSVRCVGDGRTKVFDIQIPGFYTCPPCIVSNISIPKPYGQTPVFTKDTNSLILRITFAENIDDALAFRVFWHIPNEQYNVLS